MKRPEVLARIAELEAVLIGKLEASAEEVVQELVRVGFSDIRAICSWDEDRVEFIPSAELSETAARSIASVKSKTRTTTKPNLEVETTVELEVKMHPKMDALGKLGDHLNLWKKDETADRPLLVLSPLPEAPAAGPHRIGQGNGHGKNGHGNGKHAEA